jgi:hypothetical protein
MRCCSLRQAQDTASTSAAPPPPLRTQVVRALKSAYSPKMAHASTDPLRGVYLQEGVVRPKRGFRAQPPFWPARHAAATASEGPSSGVLGSFQAGRGIVHRPSAARAWCIHGPNMGHPLPAYGAVFDQRPVPFGRKPTELWPKAHRAYHQSPLSFGSKPTELRTKAH